METFADYILNEKEIASKIEIAYYLSKKTKIYFDKSVVFKLEITRLFLNYSKIEVDNNLILTATLLCNCKKIDNAQDIKRIQLYAKEGAEYLRTLGFNKRFCKICEEVNRYSKSIPREKESDIIELIDQFGAMLLDRPERIGFKPDEALVLLEHRNFKDEYNRYINTFIEFVNFIEQIRISGSVVEMTALRRLVKMFNEDEEITKYIKDVIYEFEPTIDKLIDKHEEKAIKKMFKEEENPNRPLFSEETTKKIMSHINSSNIEKKEDINESIC